LHYSSVAVISFSFGVFLPFIRHDLQLSSWEAGVLQGIWWVTSALLSLPCGTLFSRFRPVPLVLTSLLSGIPFLFLQGLANSFQVLFLARFCFVCCAVLATPVRPLLLQQWVAPRHYALANAMGLSLHSLLLAAAMSTSALVIAAVGSWRLAYFIYGGFFGLQIFAWSVIAQERFAPIEGLQRVLQEQQDTPLHALWIYPRGWLVGVTMFAMSATWTSILTFLPTLLLEEHNIPLTVSGPLLGFLYYGLIPCSLLAGWLAQQVPNHKLLLGIPALGNVLLGVLITLTASPWLLMIWLTGLGVIWIVLPHDLES
jgi:cyanate permease